MKGNKDETEEIKATRSINRGMDTGTPRANQGSSGEQQKVTDMEFSLNALFKGKIPIIIINTSIISLSRHKIYFTFNRLIHYPARKISTKKINKI